MIFEVEFLCFDERPLRRDNRGLVPFLEKLHQNDIPIAGPPGDRSYPYYRGVGALNKKKRADGEYNPAFFKTRNSIKFPAFESLKLADFESDNYELHRLNRVRRHFYTSDYGVINRLRLGFGFRLETKNGAKKSPKSEQKDAFELIEYILGMPVKTGLCNEGKVCEEKPCRHSPVRARQTENCEGKEKKNGECPRSDCKGIRLRDLGEKWLPDTVQKSTRLASYNNKKKNGNKKRPVYLGATAVMMYKTSELTKPPQISDPFRIDDHPQQFKLFYCDYIVPVTEKPIRIYIIEHDKKCPPDFIHSLKSHLLNMKTNFDCLEHALEMNTDNKTHTVFVKKLKENILSLRDSKQCGFLDLRDQDRGEVCTKKRRDKINNNLKPYLVDIYGL